MNQHGQLLQVLLLCVTGSTLVTTTAAAELVLRVAADGSGDFRTIQAAIDSIPDPNQTATSIVIEPGFYYERIHIPRTKPLIRLLGKPGDAAKTVLSYDLFAGSVVPPATRPVGTSGSASTTVLASDFSAENITFENTAGQVGQAVALRITGDRGVFRNCRFLGWQDTLCIDGGRQLFEQCYVEGRVDFIFGRSTAVFDRCEIRSKQGGYITAARTPPESRFGFVFLDCTLVGDDVSAFLGRPWQWDRGSNAAVGFIRCRMGPHVHPEGWNPWHLKDKRNDRPETVARFREFRSLRLNGEPLDVSGRVAWSMQLSAEEAGRFTRDTVLRGTDGWNP